MRPEEIFTWQVWVVMQEVKEQDLSTVTDKPVKYRLSPTDEIVIIPISRKRDLLYKLEEMGAFIIRRNANEVRIGTGDIFYLIINRKRFDEIYEEFRQKNIRDDQVVEQQNQPQQENLNIRYKKLIEEINPANTTTNLNIRYQKALEKVTNDTDNKIYLDAKYDVLQAIWTVYESHSRADAVLVPVAAVAIKNRTPEDIDRIMQELQNEGLFTEWERKDRYFNIQSLNHIKLPKAYERVGTNQNEKVISDKPPDSPTYNYMVTYESRDILLNGKSIARPNFDGENDLVFNYLISNPNKKFTRKQIEEEIKIKLKKTLHKIVENLGFKGDLRKLFFNVSGSSIQFNNPISTSLKLDTS